MLAGVALEHIVRIRVVFPKFLNNILANITVVLLDLRRNLHLVLGWNNRHLSTLTHEVEHELRNVAASNWNVLDRAADNVALRAGDDVRYTITRVDDSACQGTVCDTIRGPRSGECKYGLDSDIQAFDVEGLEEDFGSLLSVLGCIERRFGL